MPSIPGSSPDIWLDAQCLRAAKSSLGADQSQRFVRNFSRGLIFWPSSFTFVFFGMSFLGVSKFICSRIKKRREPRVTVVTLKLCGDRKSLYSLYERRSSILFFSLFFATLSMYEWEVGGYIANLLDFYSYRLIGKLTAFLQLQEFSFRRHTQVASSPSATRLSSRSFRVK
jgi:hypothetical protein